jgi:hypothetical protein
MHYFCNLRSLAGVQVTNHVDNQHHIISNAKLCGKYFLEIFQKDMEGGIETADKFSLIFLMEKGVQLIFPTHPLSYRLTLYAQ